MDAVKLSTSESRAAFQDAIEAALLEADGPMSANQIAGAVMGWQVDEFQVHYRALLRMEDAGLVERLSRSSQRRQWWVASERLSRRHKASERLLAAILSMEAER